MADGSVAPLSGVGEQRLEFHKEASTMALYVAICLMASLIVIPESAAEHTPRDRTDLGDHAGPHAGALVRLPRLGRDGGGWHGPLFRYRIDWCPAAGRGGVAVLVPVGVLLLPDSVELEGAVYLLAALISLIGIGVARGTGASLLRAVVYTLFVLLCAVTMPS